MNVQDFLKTIDRDRLYELYCTVDEEFAKRYSKGRLLISDTIDEFLRLKPKKGASGNTVLFDPYEGKLPYPEGPLLGNVHGLGPDEYKGPLFGSLGYRVDKAFLVHPDGSREESTDPLYLFMNPYVFVIAYGEREPWGGMDFSPWNEIAGFIIPDEIIEKYGADVIAVNIFYEIIYNGWTATSQRRRSKRILSSLSERPDSLPAVPVEMRRNGLFWVICAFDENGEIVLTNTDKIISCQRALDDTRQFDSDPMKSHADAWISIHEDYGDGHGRGFTWTVSKITNNAHCYYYPRGRVEIRGTKAIVFHHPQLVEMEKFKDRIIELFELDNADIDEVIFKADGSAHYTEGVGK